MSNRSIEIAKLLETNYPNPETELNHKNEYQLVISVILSAQTTDKKVNQVTQDLFRKYPNWERLSKADSEDVEKLIREVNFYKGKSQRIIKSAQTVVEDLSGVLPKNIKGLEILPGVARKSANVILRELWGIAEGIVVDTHVSRVSKRLGLTENKDPKKIEKDLMKIIPKKYWLNFSGSVVLHGRYVCIARKPKCAECCLKKICPSFRE